MKILTNAQYEALIESKKWYDNQRTSFLQELKEAKNLKTILEKISGTTINGIGFSVSGGSWDTIDLPDNVLVYVDDILGGNGLKLEGIKCLVIDRDGKVKTGLTKQKADKGYSYKLVRD